MKHEEMKEMIRESVREAIVSQVNNSQEEQVDESVLGSIARATGMALGGASMAAGSIGSIISLMSFSFPGALAGLGLGSAGLVSFMAVGASIGNKLDNRALKSKFIELANAVKERDRYLETADSMNDKVEALNYLERNKAAITRATKKQEQAAKQMRATMNKEEAAMERLSGPERNQLEALLDKAEQGLVVNA